MPLRTSLAAALAAPALVAGALAGGPAASAAAPEPGHADRSADHRLTITVQGAGEDKDGTFELECAPAGGTHPDPVGACEVLHAADAPFATTGEGDAQPLCTYVYGGPATATVQGVWNGEPVHAEYSRTNGCEIARWDALVPVLPGAVT